MLVAVLHSLLFDVIPHPSVSYRQVFIPILYFQPSLSQSDSRHFHFNLSELFFHSFIASALALSGDFLPTGVFILCSLSTFSPTTCFYQGFPGNQQFFLEVCRASCWSSKYRPGPCDCLIHSNPIIWFTAIHNLDIQKNSYLKRIKYYHELLVVKTLVICSLLVLNSFCLFKVYVKTRKNTLNKDCTTYNRFDETTHQSYFEKAATRFVCLKEAKCHRE